MKVARAPGDADVPMVVSTGTVLRFRRNRPGPDETLTAEVDLGDLWLPPVAFTHGPTSIADHIGIVETIQNAANLFAGRQRNTKTAHQVLVSQVFVYAKLFEFAWLNGCFTLSALTRVHTDLLASKLAEGGWYSALQIEQRTRSLIDSAPPETIRELLHTHNGVVQVAHEEFASLIGTSVSHRELGNVKALLAEAVEITHMPHRFHPMRREPAALAGMSESGLNGIFTAVNTLVDPTDGDRLTFVPYTEPTKLASELGKSAARTPDLEPNDVAAILKVAFECFDRTGEALLDFCDEFLRGLEARKHERSVLTFADRAQVFQECPAKTRLEAAVNSKIAGIQQSKFGRLTVYALLEDLFSACFIIIAMLNARRTGEIAGRGVGLYSDSLRIVDEELDLYECDFFIEKTHQCRVPFFVGNATAKAITLLSKLAKLAIKYRHLVGDAGLHALEAAHSIFLMPITGRNGRAQAFSFSARPGKTAERIIRKALGAKHIDIGAHVFRRAYALLFFYRYENSDLLALSQHLCHLDVTATRIYVTDAHGGTSSGKPYRRLSVEQRRALLRDAADLDEQLAIVSAERLEVVAREVIEGRARYSGGFAKLVQRFHQRYLSRFEYRTQSTSEQSGRLASAFVARGHRFEPMPHGNCVAVEGSHNRNARCFSPELGTIDRAEASAHTCASCPYHLASQEHLRQLEIHAADLSEELQVDRGHTVMRSRAEAELRNLSRAIALHRERIGD